MYQRDPRAVSVIIAQGVSGRLMDLRACSWEGRGSAVPKFEIRMVSRAERSGCKMRWDEQVALNWVTSDGMSDGV